MEPDPATTGPPVFRKRRKLQHLRVREPSPVEEAGGSPTGAVTGAASDGQEDEASLTLKEILRQRKRPRDRLRESYRKATASKPAAALVPVEAPSSEPYRGRFTKQTDQVIDQDDKQIAAYVDARMAEWRHQNFGVPLPQHLSSSLKAATPTLHSDSTVTSLPETPASSTGYQRNNNTMASDLEHDKRLAVGTGKLLEVDLGPSASTKTIEAWMQLQGEQVKPSREATPAQHSGKKNGKWQRREKRRNSEDLRRDAMVEAIMHEAKLDFYQEEEKPVVPATEDGNADDAMLEQFKRDYLESIEERNQRKPAAPPNIKGAKDQPKGPKLGGSRSARAAMRLQEEQAAKKR
ncbi:hypothetical protein EJ04DRAFT_484525 [Polyplosphaeria fusca]|uniref:Hepatocellular carcinoma-associated antigen 59-domain-containing protein n=1 Tax=Polyplosphaeria fusca TaxID=682080 RepID=A0A9P4RAR1_9PLEO|nr:hypothetical protein EJ04DRAFT_484525 [Polyplosphaeria fusca]